ncbi:hypothetical protein Pcac1_g16375 [Phytophthora cactorum]|nr:hypothetical protein Pcac1_g16375 [Phytophthora cactorum]KAG2813153.1 hypothetical protein PC111_g14526 [Phytophthora cactorum]KAG3147973.1 hypothetical protein C6341_g17567 [Phytophthora cactorum]
MADVEVAIRYKAKNQSSFVWNGRRIQLGRSRGNGCSVEARRCRAGSCASHKCRHAYGLPVQDMGVLWMALWLVGIVNPFGLEAHSSVYGLRIMVAKVVAGLMTIDRVGNPDREGPAAVAADVACSRLFRRHSG